MSESTGAPAYFHVGILVADLDVAMARFNEVHGLTFRDPIDVTFAHLEDPEPHEGFLRCTYSCEGPPYIELLEANGDGLFSLRHGEGIHHLGQWQPGLTGRCAVLSAIAMESEARVIGPDGEVFSYFSDPAALHGVRWELLDESSREMTEHWITTGEFGGPTGL